MESVWSCLYGSFSLFRDFGDWRWQWLQAPSWKSLCSQSQLWAWRPPRPAGTPSSGDRSKEEARWNASWAGKRRWHPWNSRNKWRLLWKWQRFWVSEVRTFLPKNLYNNVNTLSFLSNHTVQALPIIFHGYVMFWSTRMFRNITVHSFICAQRSFA